MDFHYFPKIYSKTAKTFGDSQETFRGIPSLIYFLLLELSGSDRIGESMKQKEKTTDFVNDLTKLNFGTDCYVMTGTDCT
jgi:hypothetical protein